jgi:tetratricopeptide (TPR) repeat protein
MKKWVVVAVLALFAGTATAQEQFPPGGKEFKDGETAFKKKDWDAAITNFEAAVSANDTLFASHYYLGWAYQNKRNFTKSAESFIEFLDKAPSDPDAADMLVAATRQGGLAYARGNQFEQAIPLLNKAAETKPNDAEVHFFLGVSQMTSGNEQKAEEHFVKVNQLQPNLDRAWYYAGRIAFNNEDWASGKTRLSKYIELKPDGNFAGDAHFMLGSMAMTGGSKVSAKSHLTKALQLKPNSPQAAQSHYILGSLAAQAEELEVARSHFQRYLQLQPTGPQAVEVKKFLADLK